jgi:copper transport protein
MILTEFGLFALVLALTAALGQVEPPRTEIARHHAALETGQGFSEMREQGGRRLTLSIAPARAGHNVIAVTLDGSVVDAGEVTIEMALPAAGIEPLRRQAGRDGPGRFSYHSTDLALAGTWRIAVEVLIDDFTRETIRFEVPIR